MQTDCCGHFSTEVELLAMHHTAVVLRVPVRRCALAERMIAIISMTEEGREIAEKIQILGSRSGEGAGKPPDESIRAAFGPDLEAINRGECTVERCRQSCTPGFRQVLSHFGYIGQAEEETGADCLENV